jgi:hypothetical protein
VADHVVDADRRPRLGRLIGGACGEHKETVGISLKRIGLVVSIVGASMAVTVGVSQAAAATWGLQSTPTPLDHNGANAELFSVSCTSASVWMAVGSYVDSMNAQRPLAERWDGSSWTLQQAAADVIGQSILSPATDRVRVPQLDVRRDRRDFLSAGEPVHGSWLLHDD